MSHKDTGWRPHLGMETYKGHEMWDHDIGPHQINDGEVDGEIELEELLGGIDEIDDEDA